MCKLATELACLFFVVFVFLPLKLCSRDRGGRSIQDLEQGSLPVVQELAGMVVPGVRIPNTIVGGRGLAL